jgi:hypothetical protein
MAFTRRMAFLILCVLVRLPLHGEGLPADYFPGGKHGGFPMDDWFARYLSEMKEPSLYKLSKEDSSSRVYRFVYFPPYDAVTAYRLEVRPDGTGWLELGKMEQVEVQMSYEPGRLVRKAKFLISKGAVDHYLALLKKIHFQDLAKSDVHSKPLVLGAEAWLYETADHGEYHLVERDVPEYFEIEPPGDYLMSLTGEGT